MAARPLTVEALLKILETEPPEAEIYLVDGDYLDGPGIEIGSSDPKRIELEQRGSEVHVKGARIIGDLPYGVVVMHAGGGDIVAGVPRVFTEQVTVPQ